MKIWPYLRGRVKFHHISSKLSGLNRSNRYIIIALLNKFSLISIRNANIIFKKIETSISLYNMYIGKMSITGLSFGINGVKLKRIIQVGTSECGR